MPGNVLGPLFGPDERIDAHFKILYVETQGQGIGTFLDTLRLG
jgi:hypothetical protein